MDIEKKVVFNQVLMIMSRTARTKKWLLAHSIEQETLDEMLELGYLIIYEKDEEEYYKPTVKSKEIW